MNVVHNDRKFQLSDSSPMTALVRVKDKFQVTLPAKLRTAAAIREGDYLEISIVPEGILLRPRSPASAGRDARTLMEFLRQTRGGGRSKAEIDAELKARRDEW